MSPLVLPILFIMFDIVLLYFVLTGAPYMPTRREGIERIMALCEIKPGDKAADIGSGDGRIVIALAKAGAEAHGYEINPILVWWSRKKIRDAGLAGKAFIHQKNLWTVDFSPYQAVTLFGVTHIMRALEKKLRRELPPGARAVSLEFRFPTWPVARNIGRVYVYEQPT